MFIGTPHMGLDGVSKDLTSWLVDMIRFAKDNRDIQLIVRTHPGELRVQKYRNQNIQSLIQLRVT